jgi:hypothetical protein
MKTDFGGYNNVTPNRSATNPAGGVLVGSSRPLTLTLTDEAGDPITGAAASIDLTVYEPGGTELSPTLTVSEVGSTGVYTAELEFTESGTYVWDWLYDDGNESVRVGSYCVVYPVRTIIPV